MNETRYVITVSDMGGWLRVFLDRGEPASELARPLSECLTKWIRANPHLRVKNIVPISRDGDTVELHVWFEQRD